MDIDTRTEFLYSAYTIVPTPVMHRSVCLFSLLAFSLLFFCFCCMGDALVQPLFSFPCVRQQDKQRGLDAKPLMAAVRTSSKKLAMPFIFLQQYG